MDDETRAAFAALMARMNGQHERLLDAMTQMQRDFQNTKGFLIEDALVIGQRTYSVEKRLDRLERPGDAP